jgi:hypothetical protein
VEENHKTMEKDWEREQKKLQHVIEDKERFVVLLGLGS